MNRPKKKVLIVGAGLAGLTLYRVLDKKRFDIDMIEKRDKLTHVGYAITLLPSGVKVLRRLGFTPQEIDALGSEKKDNYFRDKQGKPITNTDLQPIIKRFDKYFIITRKKLYDLVSKDLDAVSIRFTTNFNLLDAPGHYDLIVGADGAHSAVRTTIFPRAKQHQTGLTFTWAWIPRKDITFFKDTGAMGDERHGLGFFDSGEKSRVCIFFYLETKEVPKAIMQKDYPALLREQLKDFGSPVPEILKNLPAGDEMFLHNDLELNLTSWHKGIKVLIGDAAHTRSVFSGAGTSLAMEDALVLGTYLSSEKTIVTAVRKYEKTQKDRIKTLVLSDLLTSKADQIYADFFASSTLFEGR